MTRFFFFCIFCVMIVVPSCTSRTTPSLQGKWLGDYAMFPAIFNFHGDSVAVTLAGKFADEKYDHADSNGFSIVHVPRPNVWFKFIFLRADSATVIINPREKIEVVREEN